MAPSAIQQYINGCMPQVPSEVTDYVVSILTENADEFHSDADVMEAVGDILISSCTNVSDAEVNDLCRGVLKIMHEDGKPETSQNGLKRVETGPVNLNTGAAVSEDADNIWMKSTRDGTTVDAKKLEKAELRILEKQGKRDGVDGVKKSTKQREVVTASVSQASNRKENKDDASQANAADIRIEAIDLSFGNRKLLENADMILVQGRRYGLVGRNGIGKTTLLSVLSSGQLSIPNNLSMLHVEQEVVGDDTPILESVLSADTVRSGLIDEEKSIQARLQTLDKNSPDNMTLSNRLTAVYQALEACEADKAPARAAAILNGLGFESAHQQRPTKEYSGGWRMRLALARALFMTPDLLLLDEPTNMLDMKAIYWLENHLQKWPTTIFCVSHDRNFLNAICTDVIHMYNRKLTPYRGNYDNFEKEKEEHCKQQQRDYEAQLELRAHTQAFIDKFRYNAKRASMVQSRIKMLERLPVLAAVETDPPVILRFPDDIEKLAPPVIRFDEVSFRYNPKEPFLFEELDCNADSDSRVCIVGDNGTGKTTLLKLMLAQMEPTIGTVTRNRRVKVGYFTQHHVDQLDDMDVCSVEVMAKRFPGLPTEQYRANLGRFGVTGELATRPISSLSGGQKSRLAFALLAMMRPNFMILDEPTNHLDVESVEALGKALKEYTGGVVLVSHDERLIEIVCKELWLIKDRRVMRLDGGLNEYKKIVYKALQLT